MAVVRTYLCSDCNTRFEKLHFDISEPPPECPGCAALAARQVPSGFSIRGNASKAGDITQDILEKDYGLTDFRDNQREGDLSVITPPHLHKHVDGFFGQSGPIIAAARAGAAAAKAEGSNPLTIVQKAAKQVGTAKVICRPVAKA